MQKWTVLLVFLLTFVMQGAIIVVDPDAAAPGTDISTYFTGVTLTAMGTGYGSGPNVYAVSPTPSFTASTGSLVFGTDSQSLPMYWREPGFLNLRVDFAYPTTAVYLDFIADDSSENIYLSAYDSGGALIGTVTSSMLAPGVDTLALLAPDISYILAGGLDGGSAVGLDNLRYEGAIPEPSTLFLIAGGLALLGMKRRRTL